MHNAPLKAIIQAVPGEFCGSFAQVSGLITVNSEFITAAVEHLYSSLLNLFNSREHHVTRSDVVTLLSRRVR
jgi:hypothetical protein